jgi:hypothetical protein
MTRAISARQAGDDLQAMLFFIEACRLLQDHEYVKEVGFEVKNAQGFDDIMVTYTKPISDNRGGSSKIDFIQVKFHVRDEGMVTADDLIDPKFIGATSESLLKKVHRLQQRYAPEGTGCRLILRQPYRIDPNDPLVKLVDQRAGALELETLFSGGERSQMGKLRKKWCEHIGVDEKNLSLSLMPFRMPINTETLVDVRSRLNTALQNVGLKPVEATQLVNPYEHLVWKLVAMKDEVKLDRDSFVQFMKEQNLYMGPPLNTSLTRRLGLKSYPLNSSYVGDKTDAHYSCIEFFENKDIRNPDHWRSDILPGVISFFDTEVHPGEHIHLCLEAHYTIIYIAGYASARCNAKVWPEQEGEVWKVSAQPVRPFDKLWDFIPHQLQRGEDIAVAVSVSQDVRRDVMRAIEDLDLPIDQLIEATVFPNVSRQAINGADHAYLLAQDLMQHIQKVSAQNARHGRIHLFVSVPNALMFYIGQEGRTLRGVQLYEYNGNYTPTILIE